MARVVCHIEAEERAHVDRLLATTEELEKARSRIWCLEQELEAAKDELVRMVVTRPQQLEPVALVNVQNINTPETVHTNKTPVTEAVLDINPAQA